MIINKEKNFISAVIYCYNCQNSIENFLQKINIFLCENFERYEIVCVNDCSTDKTKDKINEFCENNKVKSLTLVNTSFFQGIENAMIAGQDIAIGDFVFEFDSIVDDFDSGLILDVYKKSLTGFDVVFAVPKKSTKCSSGLFYKLFNGYSNSEYRLKTVRFGVISRRGINRVKSMGVKTVYRKAVYASCGLPICDVEYIPAKTQSQADYQKETKKDIGINSLILFTDIGYKISVMLTAVMSLVLLLAGIYTVAVFISADPVAGWTTTMLVMSFGFFGLFVVLAFVLKYLSVILNLVFTHKQYVIESIQKITK